ncbi:MAG TPA: S8 family peptidase [Polyangia bacterium]
MKSAVFLLSVFWLALPARAQEIAPGKILVRYRVPRAIRGAVRLGSHSARALRRVGATELFSVPGAGPSEIAALAARLANDPDVAWAEPDYVRHRLGAGVAPNDPRYPDQWALPMIRAPQAWSRTTGSTAVTVAVLDSGVLPHPDLAARLQGGYDFVSDPQNGGDGDGRDADPTDPGDSTEASSALHGLHVAGILGAIANNGLGVTGLDWSCRVEPVRVLGVNAGTGVDSDIADAIRWAAGLSVDGVPDNPNPAQVINLSFGGAGLSQTMQAAVSDAIAQGVTVVAAAGNLGIDAAGDSPAALDGVITVGAVDPTGQRASYSNYGPVVALMAPGGLMMNDDSGHSEGVLSTMELPGVGFTYVYLAGTSQATPFVAGAVALMKAVYPSMTPAEARKLLQLSADPIARCADPDDPTKAGCGAGLLDVDAALVLAATEADCTPACGDGLLCSAGQCVSATSLGGPGTVDNVTIGGCTASGAGSSRGGAGALVLLALLLVASRASIRYKSRDAQDHL